MSGGSGGSIVLRARVFDGLGPTSILSSQGSSSAIPALPNLNASCGAGGLIIFQQLPPLCPDCPDITRGALASISNLFKLSVDGGVDAQNNGVSSLPGEAGCVLVSPPWYSGSVLSKRLQSLVILLSSFLLFSQPGFGGSIWCPPCALGYFKNFTGSCAGTG